jgi:polyisoprenoid-binding protein YceI
MVPEDSSISFRGKQMGKDFDGKILKFTAQIYFDPAQLEQSKVIAEMDMRFIDANDDERNKNLLGKEWLDVIEFPSARFETHGFKKTGDSAYVADATLTIHGVIQEIEFPFTLEFSAIEKGKDSGKEKAVMSGSVTLDRSKFQLGLGDWADPSVIANEIPVEVKVTAISPKP